MSITQSWAGLGYCANRLVSEKAGTDATYLVMNATCLRHDVVSYAIQNPMG